MTAIEQEILRLKSRFTSGLKPTSKDFSDLLDLIGTIYEDVMGAVPTIIVNTIEPAIETAISEASVLSNNVEAKIILVNNASFVDLGTGEFRAPINHGYTNGRVMYQMLNYTTGEELPKTGTVYVKETGGSAYIYAPGVPEYSISVICINIVNEDNS